ncbi:hypothetical protein C5B90_03780 [Haloferax sp. Atlit-12N]|uniref:hypothetical protein n=1 Tax=Haloferax sp. Atlit-12N TaxID=2077203 RepID=UPI000E281FB4|nr:hypothetical protein [Haloferax sp. Atlit-12N]RDZ65490.1 hypothetical protein C5B90_03780 [Haloferax sp. Atlit-12N]
MSDEVGLPEAVSMAIGGMVGGGIFAVLAVVVVGVEVLYFERDTIADEVQSAERRVENEL